MRQLSCHSQPKFGQMGDVKTGCGPVFWLILESVSRYCIADIARPT